MWSQFIIALISLTIWASLLLSSVNAQVKDSGLAEARKAFKDAYEEQDRAKKYEKAKAFFERFPTADDEIVCCDWVRNLRRFVERYELAPIYKKCAEADTTYFATPNADNLNNLTTACDAYLAKIPTPDIVVSNRLALATGFGVLAGFYKDTDRSFSYAEKSLQLLAPTAPPKDWPPETWTKFRIENIGRLLQYQGLFKLRQDKPDAEAAIVYLTKAVEAKDGPAFRDLNTYLLRAEANDIIFSKLDAEYNALPADSGKEREVLERIYPVADSLISDYARIVVLAKNNAGMKIKRDEAKKKLRLFSKVREKNVATLLNYHRKEFGIK